MLEQGAKNLMCHVKRCSVSEVMLPEVEAYIELWRVINSKSMQHLDAGRYIDLTGEDIEVLIHLDAIHAEVEEQKREARRK
jgi:hypothetical protein